MSKEQYVHHSPWDLSPTWARGEARVSRLEVVEWPRASAGRSSSCGRRDKRLLAEVEYTELVSNEVQTPEEEGLEWHKDGRNPHPSKWGRGKLQRAEANHIA